ncbi:MAG: hypothetical protein ABII12_17335 [Planctomycetota bacterium]
MWYWIAVIVVAAVVLPTTVSALGRFFLHRRRYAQAAASWRQAAPDERIAAMLAILNSGDAGAPAWYLVGCAYLQQCRAKEAARAFGMAHHADWRLETAALLTFACLKTLEGEDSDLIEQIVTTWREMRKPDLTRHREDRFLLDCLASTTRDPPRLSALGRIAWIVVGPAHQARIEQLASAGGDVARDLLPDRHP